MQNNTLERNYYSFSQHLKEKSNDPKVHTLPISYKTAPQKVTLGISVGSRIIGFAITKHNELLFFKLKDFKGRWCTQKQRTILEYINHLYKAFHVTEIICKQSICTKHKRHTLVEKLHKIFIDLKCITIRDIRSVYKNVSIMINELTTAFPELTLYKKRYHTVSRNSYKKLFEAVAMSWNKDIHISLALKMKTHEQ